LSLLEGTLVHKNPMSVRGVAVATSAAVAVAGISVGINVLTARADEPGVAAARAAVPAAASLAPPTPGGERLAAIQKAADARADKRRAIEKRRKAEARRQAEARAAAARAARERASRSATRTTFSGDARGIARQIAASQYGWGDGEFACLNSLWAKESGWNYQATNPSSGAYGIPQALPGSKMGAYGSDWRTNPATQIKWGLHYIDGRYGSPCSAWSTAQSKGWY
jgi:hypothetical protein